MSQTPSLPGNNEDTTNDHLSMNIHNSLYIFFHILKFKKIAACTAILGELVAKQRGIYSSFHTHINLKKIWCIYRYASSTKYKSSRSCWTTRYMSCLSLVWVSFESPLNLVWVLFQSCLSLVCILFEPCLSLVWVLNLVWVSFAFCLSLVWASCESWILFEPRLHLV